MALCHKRPKTSKKYRTIHEIKKRTIAKLLTKESSDEEIVVAPEIQKSGRAIIVRRTTFVGGDDPSTQTDHTRKKDQDTPNARQNSPQENALST